MFDRLVEKEAHSTPADERLQEAPLTRSSVTDAPAASRASMPQAAGAWAVREGAYGSEAIVKADDGLIVKLAPVADGVVCTIDVDPFALSQSCVRQLWATRLREMSNVGRGQINELSLDQIEAAVRSGVEAVRAGNNALLDAIVRPFWRGTIQGFVDHYGSELPREDAKRVVDALCAEFIPRRLQRTSDPEST